MLNKGHACSNGNLADPQTFWFGVRLSSTQKKGIFEAFEYLYRIVLCTTLYCIFEASEYLYRIVLCTTLYFGGTYPYLTPIIK